MSNWIEPNDSLIWRFLNERCPHLPLEKKQKLYPLLQKSGILPTDKIFIWVVEVSLNRLEMAELRADLAQTDNNLAAHPQQLENSLKLILKPYLETVGDSKIASVNLALELRRAVVIDASIAKSGWRGVGAALAAIFKHQNLLTVVGALMLVSSLLGGVVVWSLGAGDRRILEQNRLVTEECNTNHASDKDKNGWYTCRLWQLPMPRE